MISIRVLSTATVTALVVALAAPTAGFAQGRGAHAGGVRVGGGGWHAGGGWHGGGGFIPGAVAGAIIGGAIASAPYGYYGGPGYYAPGYYDDQSYYDDAPVVAPPAGDDAVAYCMPRSGTYLGYDGYRHPCP